MSETFFVDYPCPKCGKKGMMSYFPPGHKRIIYTFINCGNCKFWFKAGDDKWDDMIKHIKERPD